MKLIGLIEAAHRRADDPAARLAQITKNRAERLAAAARERDELDAASKVTSIWGRRTAPKPPVATDAGIRKTFKGRLR